MRDEEIGPAITVVVAKCCSCSPRGITTKTGPFRYIGKSTIAIVAIEHHPTEAGDQQVRPAIVVVVTDDCTHRPARIAHTAFVRHICEGTVVVVVVKRALRLLAGKLHLDVLRVREVDVGIAVAVIVYQCDAPAHGLDDISRLRSGEVIKMNSRRSCDVHELRISDGAALAG